MSEFYLMNMVYKDTCVQITDFCTVIWKTKL